MTSSAANTPADPAGPEERSKYDDPRRPLLRALKLGSIALLVITVLSLMIWGWLSGLPGIWGVLIGAAIGGGFVLLTAMSVLLTSFTNPATTGAVVLGGWLLKIVVLIIVLALIQDLTFYDRSALLVTTVLALVVVLSTEVWGVITSKVTYIN
ncbi:hypothetical protein [Corynebacterium alimapuense]|uniref:Uncharacterized protein n=1 Tax=Corynebacterium alimapuense TaxID=1576874 RepID=A0A3M8K5M1_9CORY|nr:hypothetical protein [Corynebacterium alimapuense]RNE48400.1 hypothetical protein C5L39_07770 [Corynebacterium alimapuense]